jgi:hypothetical protein
MEWKKLERLVWAWSARTGVARPWKGFSGGCAAGNGYGFGSAMELALR